MGNSVEQYRHGRFTLVILNSACRHVICSSLSVFKIHDIIIVSTCIQMNNLNLSFKQFLLHSLDKHVTFFIGFILIISSGIETNLSPNLWKHSWHFSFQYSKSYKIDSLNAIVNDFYIVLFTEMHHDNKSLITTYLLMVLIVFFAQIEPQTETRSSLILKTTIYEPVDGQILTLLTWNLFG